MSLKLIANIESFPGAGYIAWIESIKGLVVQATTAHEAMKELLISLKVKMAYDYGIKIDNIEEKEVSKEELDLLNKRGRNEKEINLNFA